jgi:hypothetical protein
MMGATLKRQEFVDRGMAKARRNASCGGNAIGVS